MPQHEKTNNLSMPSQFKLLKGLFLFSWRGWGSENLPRTDKKLLSLQRNLQRKPKENKRKQQKRTNNNRRTFFLCPSLLSIFASRPRDQSITSSFSGSASQATLQGAMRKPCLQPPPRRRCAASSQIDSQAGRQAGRHSGRRLPN